MKLKDRLLLGRKAWIPVWFLLGACICSGCGSGKEETEEEETVELTMFVETVSRYDGLQEDPVAKYIKDRFGIRINLTAGDTMHENGSDKETYYQLLENKLYSNDMDDIMDFGDALHHDQCREMLLKASAGGMLLNLDEWLEEYAPDICGDYRIQVRNSYRRENLYEDGGLYSLGSQGGVSCSVLPEASAWLRWDLYAQMGCPEIHTDEELLLLLEKMQAENPETPRGEKIYSLGMAGGSESSKAKEIVCDYPETKGYEPIDGFCAAYLNYEDVTVVCPLLDGESFFWNGVEFYFEANRRGLLDPESFSIDTEEYEKKINKGIYLAGLDGTLLKEKENILTGQGFRNAGYYPVSPLEDAQSVFRYEENVLGSNELAVSSTCKHPEKAVEFLNWCFTEEGSRILQQGAAGLAWREEDGKLSLTNEYIKDANLGIVELDEKYGKEKYSVLSGFSADSLDTQQRYIQIEQDSGLNNGAELWNDAREHYESGELPDVLWATCLKEIGEPPSGTEEAAALIDSYVRQAVMECVYASDVDAFARKKAKIMEEVKYAGIQDIADWYSTRVEEVWKELKPLMETTIQHYIDP